MCLHGVIALIVLSSLLSENSATVVSFKGASYKDHWSGNGLVVSRISGADTPLDHAYLHHVGIKVGRSDGVQLCFGSGALISEKSVITAAKPCVEIAEIQGRIRFLDLILGTGDSITYNCEGCVKRIVLHPGWYKESFEDNLAILLIHPEVDIFEKSSYQKPIQLPTRSQTDDSFWGWSVTATGWGYDSDDIRAKPPRWLQSLQTRIVSNFYCKFLYGFKYITDNTICASPGFWPSSSGICRGDEGGPLFYKDATGNYTLIGLASFRDIPGKTKCNSWRPSVYIRISKYLDWIQEVTAIKIRD